MASYVQIIIYYPIRNQVCARFIRWDRISDEGLELLRSMSKRKPGEVCELDTTLFPDLALATSLDAAEEKNITIDETFIFYESNTSNPYSDWEWK
jgi:hypothetical protein